MSQDVDLASTAHLRVARPSRDLRRAETFWTDGFGMQALWRTPASGGEHALLMLGWPEAPWHLELVDDPSLPRRRPRKTCSSSTWELLSAKAS